MKAAVRCNIRAHQGGGEGGLQVGASNISAVREGVICTGELELQCGEETKLGGSNNKNLVKQKEK